MSHSGFQLLEISCGFSYGPAEVVRVASDAKYGVWIWVQGKRERIEIRVTKGGRLRVGPVVKRLDNKKKGN